jgi:hypothetical protein
MKLSFLLGGAVGYVLGARAGRERYESIVRVARRVGGSQTVQSAAGVLQAQVDELAGRVREVVSAKISGGPTQPPVHTVNGSHRP